MNRHFETKNCKIKLITRNVTFLLIAKRVFSLVITALKVVLLNFDLNENYNSNTPIITIITII
jgi:hypothetical protein